MTISSITSRSVTVSTSESTRVYVPTRMPLAEQFAATADAGAFAREAAPELVAKAVEQVNEAFSEKGKNLHALIERDEATGISVVKVLDKSTEEVISQFPSKEVLAIAEAIRQYQEEKGQLLDVSA